jgi:hypothetical protein
VAGWYGFIPFTITNTWQSVVALSFEVPVTVSIPTGTCCPLTGDVILTPCATKDVAAVVFDSCDVDGIGVSGDGRIFARIL